MAEIWVTAVVGVGTAAVSGYAKSRSDKKAAANSAAMQGAMTDAESTLAMERTDFEMNRDQYYKQLERQERQRGLDEFRKFSTVQSFAPGYQNTNTNAIVVPELYDPIKAREEQAAKDAAARGADGGKKDKNFIEKHDPLTGAILGGLF